MAAIRSILASSGGSSAWGGTFSDLAGYRGAYFGPDGKRHYVSGKTKEEARKALRGARSGADQGLVFDAGSLTVAEYLDRWLKDSVQGSVRRSTYESYRSQASAI